MTSPVLIELVHVGLHNWGSKALIRSAEYPLGISTSEGHILDIHMLSAEPINLSVHLASKNSSEIYWLIINLVFVLLCIVLLIVCLLSSNGDSSEDDELVRPDSLKEVERSAGSWAQAYRDATGPDRDALELLFRCHIISTYEFAESKVSQDHIDECIWIGSHMLRQKSLAEWIAIENQAKEIFEDNAVACFQARSEARLNRHQASTPSSPSRSPSDVQSISARTQSPSPQQAPQQIPLQIPQQMPQLTLGETPRPASSWETPRPVSSRETPRPIVPRVDLRSLAISKAQSNEEDEDPYTTREYFKS